LSSEARKISIASQDFTLNALTILNFNESSESCYPKLFWNIVNMKHKVLNYDEVLKIKNLGNFELTVTKINKN
jgi:hypothetical protein